MEFRVLGKLEVEREGELVDLGAFRRRALLGLLLTAPNTVFSTDRIIDELWGEDAGPDKQNSLWVYVSGLRKALEPEREKRSEGTVLLTRSPGYLVQADGESVDAVRFERMVAEARLLLDTDAGAASVVLGEALSLWRGRALEDFTYESWAQQEIVRLESLRLEAVEARIDSDLRRGLARELISELENLAREHPLHEGLTSQLMLALSRSGRQADALRAYTRFRTRLGEELGLEPSERIRRFEEQIVTGDDAATSSSTAATVSTNPEPGLAIRGYELREELGERGNGVLYRAYQPSVGREVAIKIIRPELANDPDFIRRFEAEAQLVARLEHPHVVPLYDYWREPDAAYLVMRLMKGGTLADVIEQTALATSQAGRLVEQIGSALDASHRGGLVHGGVRPEHVLIDEEGNAYLSDFGVAAEVPVLMTTGDDRGAPDASTDVADLALVVSQALTGLRSELVQIRGALPAELLPVIDRAVDRDGVASAAAFVSEFRRALFDDAEPVTPTGDVGNPYKGLCAFDGPDADEFYGRERLVERLLTRLGERGTRGRFVAVVGPSGSGKSSVVRAGLLPAVRGGALPTSADWFTVDMTPAPHPYEELEDALLRVAVDPPASLLERIAYRDHGLSRAVREMLPDEGAQLVLVIDQFEELFTQVDDDTTERFITTLVDAVTDERSRLRIVVTLRADFYDRPLRHRGLGELLRDGTEVITPMTPDELERAVVSPIEPLGVTMEPALVADLVRDVVDRPGALPLLQYTLTELFDARQGGRIFHSAYRELGGVSGALAKRAEGLVASLGDDARGVTRQAFLRMVTLGEGTDDTRRRVLRRELDQLAVDRRFLDAVLDTFGRHRLLSFDRDPITRGPTVEISHEALLTEWKRLRDWIDGARHDVRNQRRLAEAMGDWAAAGSTVEYLLRGGRLQQLEGWSTTTSLPLSEPEQAFLRASVAERDRAAAEEEEREQRAAAAEQQARRRVRQLTGLGVVAAMVAGLAIFGIWQWQRADAATSDFEALERSADYVSASETVLPADPELALLLAVESMRSTVDLGFATEASVDAIHWGLQGMDVQFEAGETYLSTVAVRSGPKGLTGVFYLPPGELAEFAERSTDRRLTDDECRRHGGVACSEREIPADLDFQFGAEPYLGRSPDDPMLTSRPFAGTTVVVASGDLGRRGTLAADLIAFERNTGVNVRVIDGVAPTELVANARAGLEVPDVFTTSIVGELRALLGADDRAIDLGHFLGSDTLRSGFGDHLVDIGTIDDRIVAIPFDLDLKGLVFYPRNAFEQAGYRVPESWDDLIALSRRMVSDGETPWCLAFGSPGGAAGWPGTDLLESLVIRSAGVETYDRWITHEIPFDDPSIVAAGRLLEQLVFEPGFVTDPAAVGTLAFDRGIDGLAARDPVSEEIDPACWLYPQADFMFGSPSLESVAIGTELDFFPLPPIDAAVGEVGHGGANFAAPLADRPEVRAFMEFVARPGWGTEWAASGDVAQFLSPHTEFDTDLYGRDLAGPAADVGRRLGEAMQALLADDRWRFDASDLMPPEIGSYQSRGEPGVAWRGMISLTEGDRTMKEILTEIEEAWQELEADDDGAHPTN